MVGGHDGRERSVDVQKLAVDLGVEEQVVFFGLLGGNALKAVFRKCDVFCLPCRVDSYGNSEGFPTVLAEAMSCGKPVITSRHVEIPRIVEEIIVEENDVGGLAEAIRAVYESEPLREQMGKRNREIAEELFSVGNARATARILEDLVS